MGDIYKQLEIIMAKNRYTAYQHPSYELEKQLVMYIQKMDMKESLDTLKKINTVERAELSKNPLHSIKYSFIGSCTIFTRAVISAGLDSETAFALSDYYINLVDKANSRNEVQELEYKMLEDFIKILKYYKEYIYNPLINHVIYYIKKNIENKMTLKEIASFANVHPNYLSYAFKKEVGKTLIQYINENKIAAIKQCLANSNLSINEISYVFNFSNVTYFCRFFKKHTGITPMNYKKNLLYTEGP